VGGGAPVGAGFQPALPGQADEAQGQSANHLPTFLRPSARLFATVALTLALALPPLAARAAYDDPRSVDNRALIAALAAVEAARQPDEMVIVDRRLAERHGPEGVRLGVMLEMLFTVRSVPYRYASLEPWDVRTMLGRRSSQLVVLDATSIPRLRDRFTLTRLAPLNLRATRGDEAEHAVYRIAAGG
jgi:hypothetical protein